MGKLDWKEKKEGSGLSSIKPESGKLTITTIQSLLTDWDQPSFLALWTKQVTQN